MKQLLKWLETKFSRHSAADEWRPPVQVRVKRTEKAEEEYTVESSYGGAYPDHVENHGPRKDVPMPDNYACDDTIAQRQLNILNESPLDEGKSASFDPYNTGSYDKSKTWNSRSSK
jgi:hypothetical protein